MKSTIKTLIFIASMFIFLGLFVILGRFMIGLPVYYTTAAGLFAFLIALGIQGLLKNIYMVPRIKKHGIIMSFPVKSIALKDRVTAIVLPFFAVFSTWFYSKPDSETIYPSIIAFLVFLMLMELILKIGETTMLMSFTSEGVGVTGYDFRPEYTLPFTANNLPGFYEYDRIVNFVIKEDSIILTQYYDSNKLMLQADEESMRKIVGLLMSRNILPEKIH